ncbi:MAG: cupin domain-containing protein [Isosphaeraceae bacterium]
MMRGRRHPQQPTTLFNHRLNLELPGALRHPLHGGGDVDLANDEFFYILSGEMRVYVDGEVFVVTAGECMFLPRRRPHAFLIASEEAHLILLVVPGGFLEAINKMNAPAGRMEVPTDVDTVTYANADLTATVKVFDQYGIRFLTADEIHAEMPRYLH